MKRESTPGWRLVDRESGPAHIHESDDMWIAHYDDDRFAGIYTEHWTVYYRVAKRKKGAQPWAVDNKSLGNFPSLSAAQAAGEAWFKERTKEAA